MFRDAPQPCTLYCAYASVQNKNPLNTLLDMDEVIVKISQCLPLSEFVILKIYHIKIGIRPFKCLLGVDSK